MEKEIIFLTKDGHALMNKELEKTKKILYEEIPNKLKISKISNGDLRENKDHMYLQSEQQYYEREVRRLTSILEAAEIISSEDISDDEIGIGSSFILEIKEIKETGTFSLVNPVEVDLEKGKISTASPVGNALIGKRKGAKVVVALSAGKVHLRVIAINKK